MSVQQILHQQKFIYPCQISLFKQSHNSSNRILLYSPINHYASVYDCSMQNHELINLGQTFNQVVNFHNSRQLVFNKNNQLKWFKQGQNQNQSVQYNQDERFIRMKLNIFQQEELASNIINFQTYNNHDQLFDYDDGFNKNSQTNQQKQQKLICYLSSNFSNSIQKGMLRLNFQQFSQQSNRNKQSENPEQYRNKVKSHFKQCSNGQTELPYQNKSFQVNYFIEKGYEKHEIYQPFKQNIFILDQKLSRLLQIDLQKQASICTSILCDYKPSNRMRTEINNKISFLSQNIFLSYGSDSIIKIIDKRLNRIVHIRDLNHEYNQNYINVGGLNDGQVLHNQNNFIKFYNTQKGLTQQYCEYQSLKSSFLINLGNSVIQADLRINRINSDMEIYKSQSKQAINNYSICRNENNQNFIAFNTQGHSMYKGVVAKFNNQMIK